MGQRVNVSKVAADSKKWKMGRGQAVPNSNDKEMVGMTETKIEFWSIILAGGDR